MRKMILFLIFAFNLGFPAAAMSEYYVIRLKNGGALATPAYWSEGAQIYFLYAGGTVGLDRLAVERVEKLQGTRNVTDSSGTLNKGSKELPLAPLAAEKSLGLEKPPIAAAPEEKVNIADFKTKKDKMTVDLNELMEKQREVAATGDNEAKDRAREEMVKKAKEIYNLTDEVTEKNKGKLPEGWWAK